MCALKISTQISSEKLNISYREALNNITVGLQALSIAISSIHKSIDYDAAIKVMSKSLYEFCDAIKNAGCNEEYIESYKVWGKYGWSLNTTVNKKFFVNCPESLEKSDLLMQQYCNEDEVSSLLSALNNTDINKKDLDEAHFAFTHKKYKSCAMLLFSLIDKQLINMEFINENGNIKTGCSAICALKKNGEKTYKDGSYLVYLQYILIMYCLIELFQNYPNFQKEPKVVNRNFLIHGMCERDITEIDCFKILCALYSLAVVYPDLGISANDDASKSYIKTIMDGSMIESENP